jgi:hypothetical protein
MIFVEVFEGHVTFFDLFDENHREKEVATILKASCNQSKPES